MTSSEIITEVHRRKLFVNGGPVVSEGGELRQMFWVVTDRPQGDPRGFGPTLEAAYRDFIAESELEGLM